MKSKEKSLHLYKIQICCVILKLVRPFNFAYCVIYRMRIAQYFNSTRICFFYMIISNTKLELEFTQSVI